MPAPAGQLALATKDTINVGCCPAENFDEVGYVAHQAAVNYKLARRINRLQTVPSRQRNGSVRVDRLLLNLAARLARRLQ